MRKVALLVVFGLFGGAGIVFPGHTADAQTLGPQFSAGRHGSPGVMRPPRRPPLSPYLNLLRTDSGVLPPYHAFVVPRRRIAQQQTAQWQAINQLRSRAEHAEQGGDAESLPTGRGGHFQNYLHYYRFQRPN